MTFIIIELLFESFFVWVIKTGITRFVLILSLFSRLIWWHVLNRISIRWDSLTVFLLRAFMDRSNLRLTVFFIHVFTLHVPSRHSPLNLVYLLWKMIIQLRVKHHIIIIVIIIHRTFLIFFHAFIIFLVLLIIINWALLPIIIVFALKILEWFRRLTLDMLLWVFLKIFWLPGTFISLSLFVLISSIV